MVKEVAIDYETFLISAKEPIPKPVCLSWYNGVSKGLYTTKNDIEEFLIRVLSCPETVLIAHNATFEVLVTYTYFPSCRELLWNKIEKNQIQCTQLRQQLIDNVSKKEIGSHGLANLVKIYFGIDISECKTDPKAWRLRYSELYGVPRAAWPQEAVDYAINDSVFAYKLYKAQIKNKPEIKQEEHLYASTCLNLMAARGMLTDTDKILTVEREVLEVLNPVYEFLLAHGFMKIGKKGASKNIVVLRDYIKNNFSSYLFTKGGDIATSGEALEFLLVEKSDLVLRMFRFIGTFEKIKSAFVARLKKCAEVDPDMPLIRTSYNPIVRSGRTSSRQTDAYPSVNIQQQPKAMG